MTNGTAEAASGSIRLKDLKLTVELVSEVVTLEHGARDRVAARHGIQKSVITNRVRRIELFFGVDLFTGPQRKSPTAAGRKMARHGPTLIREIEELTAMLRDAQSSDHSA